jgi:hypothetical protein
VSQAKLLALYNKDSDAVRVSLWADAVLDSGTVELWHANTLLHSLEINPDTINAEDRFCIMFNKPARNVSLHVEASLIIAGNPVATTIDVLADDQVNELPNVPNEIVYIPIQRMEPLVEMDEQNKFIDANKVDRNKDHVTADRPSEPVDRDYDPLLLHIMFGERYMVKRGTGEIAYQGGGNRVFWDATGLQIQNANETPLGFAFSEHAATNILDNIWLSGNTPVGWSIVKDDGVGTTPRLVNEAHPQIKQWEIQLAKTTTDLNAVARLVAPKIAINNTLPVSFSSLLYVRNQITELNAVFVWWNGVTEISQELVTFDPSRFENHWGMLAHTLTPPGTATHVTAKIVCGLTSAETPLVKVLLPNIVQYEQPTSLITGVNARIGDLWQITTQDNVDPSQGFLELSGILGGNTPGNIFDTRNGFGEGIAGIWDGANLSLIINAGSGDEILSVPWTPTTPSCTWRFVWSQTYRAIVVNGTSLVDDQTPIQMPAHVGTLLTMAQNLNCQLTSLRIERSL